MVASTVQRVVLSSESLKTTQTTIPFIKNNELDYSWFTGGNDTAAWLLYVLVAILVITAVSNGANLTDGLDGLVCGRVGAHRGGAGAMAYLSGHIVYADYLNIMYIPQSGELLVFAAATAGALIGFLWYNSLPAQIFMGDTGSLSIGGIIAVLRALHPQGAAAAPALRRLPRGEPLGDDAGILLSNTRSASTARAGASCSCRPYTTTTRNAASSRRRSSRASGSCRCCLRP